MDATATQSDLHALKRLYGLLQNVGNLTLSALLDDHARLLLKNILDAEARKVLKVCKIFSRQPEALETFSPQKEQHINALDDKKLASQWSHKNVMETMVENPAANVPDQRNRRCRVCQSNTAKLPEPMAVAKFNGTAQNPNSRLKNQSESQQFAQKRKEEEKISNDCANESQKVKGKQTLSVLSNAVSESKTIAKEVEFLSEEASKTIEHIELCISALQRQADHLRMLEDGCSRHKFSRNDSFSGKEVAGAVGYPLHQIYKSKLVLPTEAVMIQPRENWIGRGNSVPSKNVVEGKDLLLKLTSLNCQNIKGSVHKSSESGNWIASSNAPQARGLHHRADNFSVSADVLEELHDNPYFDGIFPSTSEKDSAYRQSDKGLRRNNQPRNRRFATHSGALLEEQESEDLETHSNSSQWKSFQTGSSDSQDYSEDVSSNMNRSAAGSEGSSYSSSSERTASEATASSQSGDFSSSLSRPVHHRISAKLKRRGPSRASRVKNKKVGGVWKRLKDRFAVIFHHHHHHHHHHHQRHKHSDPGSDYPEKAVTPKSSFHKKSRRQEAEAKGERAAEKISRSLVVSKNQHGHFRELMGGFMRHVWSSKPSKTRGEAVVDLANAQLRRNNTLNKSRWLQLMQHQGRAKFANRTSFKLGLAEKKRQSKALPSFK